MLYKINYNNKQFKAEYNSETGEVNNSTIFTYYQKDNIIWGDYSGGDIVKGTIVGTVNNIGELKFFYQHINVHHIIRAGECHSIPTIMSDGKIRLDETWKWLNDDMSTGSSVLYEIK
ncbi:MAG: n-acetylglutamate synthase [Clostridia bacterium]